MIPPSDHLQACFGYVHEVNGYVRWRLFDTDRVCEELDELYPIPPAKNPPTETDDRAGSNRSGVLDLVLTLTPTQQMAQRALRQAVERDLPDFLLGSG